MEPKVRAFLWSAVPVLLADRITKVAAFAELQPPGVPHPIAGNAMRFTLVFNRDAAMNLTLGSWSRWGFATIALLGVVLLLRLLELTAPGDRRRAVALGWITAGAIGNLIDRLRWDRGVVDFIDVGVGQHRFWTFNIADLGVTIGALLLAFVFSRERRPAGSSVDE